MYSPSKTQKTLIKTSTGGTGKAACAGAVLPGLKAAGALQAGGLPGGCLLMLEAPHQECWPPQPPHLHLLPRLAWVGVTRGSAGGRLKTHQLKAVTSKGACSPWGQKALESGGEAQRMQKLKSIYKNTGAEVSSFCPSDPPLRGSGPTFPYRQCQLFFERQGILFKRQECFEVQNHLRQVSSAV